MKNLCLKNSEGKVVRLIPVKDDGALIVVRAPHEQRLSFRSATDKEFLLSEGWEVVKDLTYAQVVGQSLQLTPGLTLCPATDAEDVVLSPEAAKDDDRLVKGAALGTTILGSLFMLFVLSLPTPEAPPVEEKLREQVVKIVKIQQQQPEPVKLERKSFNTTVQNTQTVKPTTKPTQAIKRMGALAVLGNGKNTNQKGGLDLGAVKTSAGPGLGGGTEGSGGVQTSLYGKGIISAPVGVGGNLKGAGGYGTKGKGGGQAGYGSLSLVGSSGASVIPVGEEVIAGGGLDQSLIWDVIRKNQGQIRFCYEQGLQSDPNLKGRIITDFVIGANGQVTSLKIANSTINSKIVEDCVSLRIKTWKFPLPEGGKSVSVKVPFNLNRQGRG